MFRGLPRISTFHYQCSKKSTSKEISSVFEKAINRQRKADHRKHRSLVFLDEAGLPEEEKESLKVLHYFLEGHMSTKAECGFVAITNHVLDAAKSNRCLSLLRQEPTDEEMIEITKGVLFDSPNITTRVCYNGKRMLTCDDFSSRLSAAYCLLKAQPWFENFFGLRDFIYFIKAIRTGAKMENDVMTTNSRLMIRACERNFGGLGVDKLHQIATEFMMSLPEGEKIELRCTLEVLKECIESKNEQLSINLRPRYKLIIDETDDDSILRFLSEKDLLPFSERISISSFPDDIDIERAGFVSKVKFSASHNTRVILSNADQVHECFYDLFNQNFRSLRNRDGILILYSNIALGGISRRSKVHPDFECIVHVRGSDVPQLPAPFLNRFEKYRLDMNSIRTYSMKGFPNAARILSSAAIEAFNFIADCNSRLGRKWIVGFKEEQTIPSLLSGMVPEKTWSDFCDDRDYHQTTGYKRFTQLVDWITGGRVEVDEKECLVLYDEMKKLCLFESEEFSDHLIEEAYPSCLLFKVEYEKDYPCELSLVVERLATCVISRDIILRLLPLAMPEAIYELRSSLPKDIFEQYISRRNNSLHNIFKYSLCNKTPSFQNLCIIHTRTDENLRIGQPFDTVFKDRIVYHQLHSIRTAAAFQSLVKSWLDDDHVDLFLLVADTSRDSMESINYSRVVFESEIRHRANHRKKLILMIHYPSLDPRSRCYPSLFSGTWEQIFLDSIGGEEVYINVNQWLRLSCCEPREFENIKSEMKPALEASLPYLLPRIALNKGLLLEGQLQADDNSFSSKTEYLMTVLNQYVDGDIRFLDIVVEKFLGIIPQGYFNDLIQRISQSLIDGRSRVSMTLAITSIYMELFSTFLRMQLSIVNRWRNLDVLRNGSYSRLQILHLFIKIYRQFPNQSIEELQLRRFQQNDVLANPADDQIAPVQTLFPFFHFVSSILNRAVQCILRDFRYRHPEEDVKEEIEVVSNIVEATSSLLREERLRSSHDITFENRERYFGVVLEVIQIVKDDCDLHNLYIHQFARFYFQAMPGTLAFRYLTERVSLLSETWPSLARNIVVVHVVSNRDRMPLIKLGSLQELGNRSHRTMTEPSSALSIDNWFHLNSINDLCEEWSIVISKTNDHNQLSVALKESVARVPFLLASGIAKKSENSGLQLRRLSLLYKIGQSGLPHETLLNCLRWIYSTDDLSLLSFFNMIDKECSETNEFINCVTFYFLSPQWLLCVDDFLKDDLAFAIHHHHSTTSSFSAILGSINRTISPPKSRSLAFLSTLHRAILCDNLGHFNDDGKRITVPRFVAPWARSNKIAEGSLSMTVNSNCSTSTKTSLRYLAMSGCDYSSALADDIFIAILSIYSLEAETMQSNEILTSLLKDIDAEFSLSRKEMTRLLRLRDLNECKSDYQGSPLAPIVVETKLVCFICKMAEEVCHSQSSPVLIGLYSETSIEFVRAIMQSDLWREFFLLYIMKVKGQGFLINALSEGGPLDNIDWTEPWRSGLPSNLQKLTESLSAAEEDYDALFKEEQKKSRTLRRCPGCEQLFEVHTMNCGTFTCGRDYHGNIGVGGYGCNQTFQFTSALAYQLDQNRLSVALHKRDEERIKFSKYQAEVLLWEQLQQKTLPPMICRLAPSINRTGSLIPCAFFSDTIQEEPHQYSILLYVVNNAQTILFFDLLPHLIELYLWLQTSFSGVLSIEDASNMKMKNIMSDQNLKKNYDIATSTHLIWLWNRVKHGVDRLIASKMHIHWGCEEVLIPFPHIEEASLLSLISEKDEPTEDTDFLFLCINQLIETYNGFALKYNQLAVAEINEDEIYPKTIMNGSMCAATISSLSVLLTRNFELLVESSWKQWSNDFDIQLIISRLLNDLSDSHILPVKSPLKYLRERFEFKKVEDTHYAHNNNGVHSYDGIYFAHSHDCTLFRECVSIVNRGVKERQYNHRISSWNIVSIFYSADYRTLRSLLEGIKSVIEQSIARWRSYEKLGDMIASIGGGIVCDTILTKLGFPHCSQTQREYLLQIDLKEVQQFICVIGFQLASESFNYAHLPLFVHSPFDDDARLFLRTNIMNQANQCGARVMLIAIEEFLTSMKDFENVIVTKARDPVFMNCTFIDFFESTGIYDDADPVYLSLPKHVTLRNYVFICQELNQNKLRLWAQTTEVNLRPGQIEATGEHIGYSLLWKRQASKCHVETNIANDEPTSFKYTSSSDDTMEGISNEDFFDCMDIFSLEHVLDISSDEDYLDCMDTSDN